MPDNPQTPKKSITPDWLVQGALTKIGDTVDRLTGRRWRPSSSLATSGLIERMKSLLDAEAREDDEKRKFVPHNITLKMQWDKFSTDSEDGLRKLEHELLTAAVDHISDQRYYTHAPLKLQVKPDYFTQGVKLFVSFDKVEGEDHEEAELNVTVPAANAAELMAGLSAAHQLPDHEGSLAAKYDLGTGPVEKRFEMKQGKRVAVGRTKENDLALDHTSVSKMHGSLLLNSDGKLVVADTGSTNGTYLNGERIAYGKAIEIFEGDKLMFGAIEVDLDFKLAPRVSPDAKTEAYSVGDMQFIKKTEVLKPVVKDETKS